ncbi:MAG: aminotransferase class I/II-fold pyridoxal phosphate-dependent enzyme [Actinobacteria bacterium]|nr:aminotransferase class I/II-fold pyridoxal phosphate-dependent enzyme [Actinomycetota bacterium]
MRMRFSDRMDAIPEYVVARMNRVIAEKRAAGIDVISLGIGDPDLPPDPRIRARLAEEVLRDDAARYPTNIGQPDLREAVAEHYARRFGVSLDPATEILPLLGAKEGLAHLALAVLDPGALSLVADPGYPVYTGGPLLAAADSYPLPVLAANDFQPDLAAVPADVAERARLLVCGYPNNPTGAVAAPDLFARLGAFGERHDLVLCHDHAYAELTFDDAVAPSALSDASYRSRGIEILSLSKAYSVPGWRIAFAVGNPEIISVLQRLKTQIDSGMFPALQRTAAWMLRQTDLDGPPLAIYRARRDLACRLLGEVGLPVTPPQGGMYLWVPIPAGETSTDFATRLLEDAAVVVTPGSAYGKAGEGYVRMALTVPEDRLREALERIGAALARS